MDLIHAPTLIDFLCNHPRLKDIEIITDEYDIDLPDKELTFTELERFTAPFTYWELVHPNPSLHFAGVHQDRFGGLEEDPFDVIHPLGKFTGLKSVRIVIPAEKTIPYFVDLKEELPTLEELSVDFSNYLDHGEAIVSHRSHPFFVIRRIKVANYPFQPFHSWCHTPFGAYQTTSLSVAVCLARFKVLKCVSVESKHWNSRITQTTAMTLAKESSKQCNTLLRARFGQRFRPCHFMSPFFFD